MKRALKTYYAKLPNMGDLLNELIIRDIFNYDLVRHTPSTCELSVIGSGMDCFLKSTYMYPKFWSVWQEYQAKFSRERVNVWCTGFIYYERNTTGFYRDMNFHSVRGKLTKARIEKMLNKSFDIPTGDGGLIASYLVKRPVEKKYKVGIIPHFAEQDHVAFKKLKQKYPNATTINLREDPLKVVEKIAACELIVSSSLHGLIVADSFGIPNQWVIVSNKLKGDNFKFDDYYSAFDLKSNPLDLNKAEMPTINQIIDNYRVSPEMVELKKQQLLEAFPFK